MNTRQAKLLLSFASFLLAGLLLRLAR